MTNTIIKVHIIKTNGELEDYRNRIVGFFNEREYNKFGGNGSRMALTDWLDENDMELGNDVDLDYFISTTVWG